MPSQVVIRSRAVDRHVARHRVQVRVLDAGQRDRSQAASRNGRDRQGNHGRIGQGHRQCAAVARQHGSVRRVGRTALQGDAREGMARRNRERIVARKPAQGQPCKILWVDRRPTGDRDIAAVRPARTRDHGERVARIGAVDRQIVVAVQGDRVAAAVAQERNRHRVRQNDAFVRSR